MQPDRHEVRPSGPIEVRTKEEFAEAVERMAPPSFRHTSRAAALERRRAFMHEREQTIAEQQLEAERARQEIEEAKAEMAAVDEGIKEIEAVTDHLKGEYRGLGRAVNFSAIQEQKYKLAGERTRFTQARERLAKAIRHEQGIRKHLENLKRKHEEDRAQVAA